MFKQENAGMNDHFGFNMGFDFSVSSFDGVQGSAIERISTLDLSDAPTQILSDVSVGFSDVCLNCKVTPDCDDKSIFCGLVAKYNMRASEHMKGDSIKYKPNYI